MYASTPHPDPSPHEMGRGESKKKMRVEGHPQTPGRLLRLHPLLMECKGRVGTPPKPAVRGGPLHPLLAEYAGEELREHRTPF